MVDCCPALGCHPIDGGLQFGRTRFNGGAYLGQVIEVSDAFEPGSDFVNLSSASFIALANRLGCARHDKEEIFHLPSLLLIVTGRESAPILKQLSNTALYLGNFLRGQLRRKPL